MHLLPLIKPKAKETQINEINLVPLTLKRKANGSTSNYSTMISSIKKVMHKGPPEQRQGNANGYRVLTEIAVVCRLN